MNKDYWDLTDKIEDDSLPVYAAVFNEFNKSKIPFLVLGVAARDIILTYYDVPLARATEDIDFGIKIKGWKDYDLITRTWRKRS